MMAGTRRRSLEGRVAARAMGYVCEQMYGSGKGIPTPLMRLGEAVKADRREAQRRAAAQLAPFVLIKNSWFPAPLPKPPPLVANIGGQCYRLIPESDEVSFGATITYNAIPWPDYVTETTHTPYPGGNDDDETETDD